MDNDHTRHFRFWHETVIAVRFPSVCCRWQSGRYLPGTGVSHFDPFSEVGDHQRYFRLPGIWHLPSSEFGRLYCCILTRGQSCEGAISSHWLAARSWLGRTFCTPSSPPGFGGSDSSRIDTKSSTTPCSRVFANAATLKGKILSWNGDMPKETPSDSRNLPKRWSGWAWTLSL